jgi:hypothetical protein
MNGKRELAAISTGVAHETGGAVHDQGFTLEDGDAVGVQGQRDALGQ